MIGENLTAAERRVLANQLRLLTSMPGWDLLMDELERREGLAISNVVRGGMTLEQYARLSGAIETLRTLPKLPAILVELLNPPNEDESDE